MLIMTSTTLNNVLCCMYIVHMSVRLKVFLSYLLTYLPSLDNTLLAKRPLSGHIPCRNTTPLSTC